LLAYTGDVRDIFRSKAFYLWIFEQLTFFQFHTPDLFRFWGVGTPNGSLWTITVEVQFYFLIPILYYLIAKAGKFKMYIILFAFLISIVCNCYFAKLDTESMQFKLAGVWVLPYLYCFILGVFAYMKWEYIKMWFEGKFLIWLSVFLTYILVLGNLLKFELASYFITNPFHIITNVFLSGLTLSAAFSYKKLSNSLIKENDISYGYIYHMLVVNYFVQNKYIGNLALFIGVVFIVIIVAFLSWKFIELPFLNLKQKKIRLNDELTKS
jgi:peptidoglycan/LPS O-acetylase OafA/YrhL